MRFILFLLKYLLEKRNFDTMLKIMINAFIEEKEENFDE